MPFPKSLSNFRGGGIFLLGIQIIISDFAQPVLHSRYIEAGSNDPVQFFTVD